MTTEQIEVHVQLGAQELLVGRFWSHRRRGSESMTFAYEDDYLATPAAYQLDPVQLGLYSGRQQTPPGREIFGAFSDCAPDRWGRRIVERRETKLAKSEGRARRSFGEADYLLGARDDLRQGALRFRDPLARTFLATAKTGVPALTSLAELLSAAAKLERGEETSEDLGLLIDAGSSLGGARPKAHLLGERDRLGIAKFPSAKDDRHNVIGWEHVALKLARAAGVTVPEQRLVEINGKHVLIVDRFDRDADRRIGYISALTMLGLTDGMRASYLEIAEAITEHSPHATRDLHQLWRRIAFTVLISNYDDHLRNHGFLRTSTAGWALSPAFDLNPDPSGKAELATAIRFGDHSASVELLISVCDVFGLDRERALSILREVYEATALWRSVASAAGLGSELEQMEPAFEPRASAEARALLGER